MKLRRYTVVRVGTLFVAVLLGVQSIWLLTAELTRSRVDTLPTDERTAIAAREGTVDAARAASIGLFRGDLWADSALTYTHLLFEARPANAELSQGLRIVDRALINSPDRSDVWLLRAGLGSRFSLPDIDAADALKMSYYTGPSDFYLMPLRLRIAAHLDTLSDPELQEMVTRELRLLLARHQEASIVAAYDIASAAGKQLIEQTVRDLDPSALVFLNRERVH